MCLLHAMNRARAFDLYTTLTYQRIHKHSGGSVSRWLDSRRLWHFSNERTKRTNRRTKKKIVVKIPHARDNTQWRRRYTQINLIVFVSFLLSRQKLWVQKMFLTLFFCFFLCSSFHVIFTSNNKCEVGTKILSSSMIIHCNSPKQKRREKRKIKMRSVNESWTNNERMNTTRYHIY